MLNIEQILETKIKAELKREIKAYVESIVTHPFYKHIAGATLQDGQTVGDFFNVNADTKNKVNVIMMNGALPEMVKQSSKTLEEKLIKILLEKE